MKKEAKAVFKKYVEGFLIHYSSEDEANVEALKITFNQFSENYFYGETMTTTYKAHLVNL